jgi:hypothetical protein
MGKLRKWVASISTGTKIVFSFALLVLFTIWGTLNRRRAEKQGEEIGHLEEAKDRLNEAVKKGDDEGVLDEFNRQTKGKR